MADEHHRTLRDLREGKGLSQDKLSELTGVAWATIAKLELGDHSPNLDTLRRLSKVLGYEVLDVDYGWKREPKKLGRPRSKKAASDKNYEGGDL